MRVLLVAPNETKDFEIVVGFVAPIGTDLNLVFRQLEEALRAHGYSSETVRLSKLLTVDRAEVSSVGYYTAAMNKGDELRTKYSSGDVVGALAIADVISRRGKLPRARRHAYLLRTLKHPDEVQLLRQTYGSRFVLVSVFDTQEARTAFLAHALKDESPRGKDIPSQVAALIERDELDPDNYYGQHVRDTFGLADYFIALGSQIHADVDRLVGLLFGAPFITPTRDEVSMFQAYGASLRSSDPGRQVGAVITDEQGDILATGANEVPKPGGGEYWPGDQHDGRDFQNGFDFNKRQSRRSIKEFIDALAEDGLLSSTLQSQTSEERVQSIFDSAAGSVKQARLMSPIEFGRIVHAEMSAITGAARRGVALAGATLYTTAFPCHMCMRLIISTGISRIVYVDPYPKSLAYEMYSDSIVFGKSTDDRVSTEPFQGTSFGTYTPLFSAINRDRKPDGTFVPSDKRKMRMRLAGIEPLQNAELLEDQVPFALSVAIAKFE